jgi:DNA-binding MarR family transcriptional regulator
MKRETVLNEALLTRPGYLARQLRRITASMFLEATAGVGISPIQYGVLQIVSRHPGIDQIGVCEAMGSDRSTMAVLVDRLEERGLVVRATGVIDRRSKALYLTDDGKRVLPRLRSAEERANKRLFRTLSAAEQKMLMGFLTRVIVDNAKYATPTNEPAAIIPKAKQKRAL